MRVNPPLATSRDESDLTQGPATLCFHTGLDVCGITLLATKTKYVTGEQKAKH